MCFGHYKTVKMKRIVIAAITLISLAGCLAKKETEQVLKTGTWRATIEIQGQPLPFNIDIEKDNANTGTKKTEGDAKLKVTGSNLYSLDLNSRNLGSGFYTLEIKNEKNETFYLKLFLP